MQNSGTYKYFFKDSPLPMWISNEDTTLFLDVNNSALKIYGYSRKTFLQKNPSEIIVTDINDGYPVHRNKKGDLLDLVIRKSKIEFKGEKAILAVITGFSDFEKLNKRFGQLAENNNDVYFIIDPSDDRTVYVSPSFSGIWERDPDELYPGKINRDDFLLPEDMERIVKDAGEEFKKGNDFSGEFRIITPGSKTKWISVKAFSQSDKEGKVQRIKGVAADITERKRSEDELKSILQKEHEALQSAEQAKEKLSFLAEASEVLSSSLDYQQTLKSVAQLATPRLSDWCVVDILDENNELKRLAVSHINPDKIELAVELHKKYGPSPDETTGVYNVIKTGTSELYPEIPEELIRAGAKDEEHLRISLELGLKSGMIVPLKVREQVFGTLTLIYAESDRRYNESDLKFVEDLARRAAIAIDNAKLFEKAGKLNSELDKKILDLEKEISNRKQIESILIDNQEKLISSEERLKAALSASETGTYRWYIDNNSLHFDDSLLKIFGLPPGIKISYEDFINRVHPEDREELLDMMDRSITQNADFHHEYRIIWDDGSIHWIMDKAKILNLDGSKPLYMTGACVDITYRKHAEQTLRDSEILFRQMAENIRDLFFIINPANNNVIYVSPIFEDIWGIKREEIYHNNNIFIESIHPEDREYFEKQMISGLKSGRYTMEYRIIRPDKSVRWLRSRGFPLYNEKKMLYRITGLTEDITDRKAAEEALHRNQELLRSTITSAPVILFAINRNFDITLLEGKELEKAGINPAEYIGKNIFKLFRENSDFIKYLEKALLGDEVSFTLEESGKWQEIRYSPLKDHGGNIKGVIGVSLDITAHKTAEEKIIASLKEKEILLKEIHHRVKNNLQIISSILSLQSGYIDDKKIQDIFEESRNRIRSMALLHEKLYQTKDFSKLNFKNYLEDLIQNLFSSYQFAADNIKLNIIGSSIHIDAEKAIPIGLIINELVSNSLKHAFKETEKGEINILFNKTDDLCMNINISDNGIGLPEGFSINNMDTLGLQIIRSLIEQLEGNISVYNDNGAHFELLIPEIAQD